MPHTVHEESLGEERVFYNEAASGTLTRSFTFSVLRSIAVYVCLVKWIYGLYYLVLIKVTLTKWSSGLKRFPQRNYRLKVVLTMQAQGNNTKMASTSTPSMSSSSAALQGKTSANLIRSDKKSARKILSCQGYLKYEIYEIHVYICCC